uniref:Uncharacterized protein n=1 Tax=Anguilla anguilla TaxID=7936 RepID=A0A0E9V3W0_ANGAN
MRTCCSLAYSVIQSAGLVIMAH